MKNDFCTRYVERDINGGKLEKIISYNVKVLSMGSLFTFEG